MGKVKKNPKQIDDEFCHSPKRYMNMPFSKFDPDNLVKTLESFELLGMNIGFSRRHVSRLLKLGFLSEEAIEMRKYVEAKVGRSQAQEEIDNLETKIIKLKEVSEKYSADVESLKYKVESFELKFQEEVDALW